MYSKYFENWDVKSEFNKEFISIFSGWLGKDNLHKLDDVTEREWGKFNHLLRVISKKYEIYQVDCENKSTRKVEDIDSVLSSYEESMKKDASKFTKVIIPKLACVLAEDWDYTYVLWHKDNGAVESLSPLIDSVGLKHFHD